MKKVTQNAVNAFMNNATFKSSNTEVLFKACLKNGKFPVGDHFIVLELFGNEIAAKDSGTGKLFITNAGWESNTTKERLNALPGVSIQQKNFVWYLNGNEWNGKLTEVKQ